MNPLDHAKVYLGLGWSLIPIVPETKKPPIFVGEFQTRRATLSEIEEWITKGWYLAVVTGDISECWWLTMTGLSTASMNGVLLHQ